MSSSADDSGEVGAEMIANVDRMVGLVCGFIGSQIVRTIAQLSIPDVLARGPATAGEVAKAVKADEGAMTRLLRAAVPLGLVRYGKDTGRFHSTQLLSVLQSDSKVSLRGWSIIMGTKGAWQPWGNLVECVQTGERQTLATLGGKEYWQHLAETPLEAQQFQQGMDGISAAIAAKAAQVIDSSQATIAADVGGASGALLHAVLRLSPKLHGIVLDLPHVIPAASAAAERAGLSDRVQAIAGNFLESVPPADLYLLKWILHDHDDAQCVTILSNCRKALRPGGRVLVMELQLGNLDDPGLTALMDLNMMIILNGRERTAAEYGLLFEAAGLRMTKTTPLKAPMGPWTIMEAQV